MTAIGLDPGPTPGDVDLVQRSAHGDELAGRELLARHRDAVADSGPSPAYESVDVSGEQALAQLRTGGAPDLPFRVLWLSLHTQGRLPVDEERRNPVWDAFCALPLPAQTALWYREVEGLEATAIAALLGTSADEVRRDLVSAYSAVRARVEESSPPSPSRGLASQLLLLQYSLRDVLAGVVLGPAAGRYLVARPRAGHRVPIEVTPARRRGNAAYVALAAAVVGAVAAASFLDSAPVDTSRSPVPQAAPFEAPIVGSYLEAVAGTSGQETSGQQASQAVSAAGAASPGSSTTAGGKNSGGKGSGGQSSGGQNAGPSGGGSPGGGSAPGGTNGGPGPAPQDDGPGQGAEHASQQGQSNGVRAHGPGNKGGKGNAKGGKSGGKAQGGKSGGKAQGGKPGGSQGKGKSANRR